MDKKKVAVPLVCHGHSRPVVDLFYSPITPDGFFLISASKGMYRYWMLSCMRLDLCQSLLYNLTYVFMYVYEWVDGFIALGSYFSYNFGWKLHLLSLYFPGSSILTVICDLVTYRVNSNGCGNLVKPVVRMLGTAETNISSLRLWHVNS